MSTKKPDESDSEPAESELSLEATRAQRQRILSAGRSQSKGSALSYNPYDSKVTAKSGDAPRKPEESRKLSEWIRTRVEALKKQKKR